MWILKQLVLWVVRGASKHQCKTIFTIVASLGIFATGVAGDWNEYFERKMKEPPREFIRDALIKISNDKSIGMIAYDVGSGVGNETILLLDNGYNVIAIDNQIDAMEMLRSRPEVKRHGDKLITITESFETLDFQTLPRASVIVASASIPFCNPKYFDKFWSDLVGKIEAGGYFLGHTFDPSTNALSDLEKSKMTFHDKEQTLAIFKDFEITSLNPVIQKTSDETKYFYHYEIVAKKR